MFLDGYLTQLGYENCPKPLFYFNNNGQAIATLEPISIDKIEFDESFDFKFITLNGECEYSSFSAGERQRIQIATILAFRDLILNGKNDVIYHII